MTESPGSTQPRSVAPADSADCHIHIFDPRFKAAFPPPPNTSAQDYRRLQQRNRTSRVVVVTPRNYVVDNEVTLDAIRQLGPDARGVAVVRPDVTDAELKRLADGGICGIRFTLRNARVAVVGIDMMEPLAKRVAGLGWHLQLNVSGEQIVEHADLLRRLPTPLVFDHMAHLAPPAGTSHPAYAVVRGLLDQGRAWVKLTGPDLTSKVGPPTYADIAPIARTLAQAAPERMVWGTDWPHPGMERKPDDARMFDLLAEWVPDEAARKRILVDNPQALYGFARSA